MVHSTPLSAWRRCAWLACPWAVLVSLSLASLTVQAQPVGKAARPDPLDPDARVPALRYASSLSTTQRPGDDKPISWREANDTVTRIGGWRVYTRQAQQPDPLPANAAGALPVVKPADSPAAPSPVPAGHAGHKSP